MMPFGLTNDPVSFQSYINGVLRLYLDITVIVYLDDVFVFSRNLFLHEKHVRKVLKALLNARLYAQLSKCLFNIIQILLLGFILTNNGVKIEEDRISTILNWSEPESVREIQSFLEFANFYRRFVKRFSSISHPLTDTTKKAAQRTKNDQALQKKYFLTPEARQSFQGLLVTFTNPPFLVYFDAKRLIRLEADTLGYTISGILSQKQKMEWKVIAYFSRKMIDVEGNYKIHDSELLAIIKSFRYWHQYLKQPYHTLKVLTDHNNLCAFISTNKLTLRQVQ